MTAGLPACVGHPTLPPSTWDARINGETTEDRTDRIEAARRVCDACPIADDCLTEGATGRGGGVRGGHVFPDRVLGYKSDDRAAVYRTTTDGSRRPPCGSPGGRKAHLKRGEVVCAPCLKAFRTANRERSALRRAADRGDVA